ncbi:Phage terminase, small subunit [Caulifigura coniformis]|uniref:Phage terminase, small subunit n=1 Tax=Caulifigura coniformis TaxID=2527983 RepID=A0A517SET7_9PLAN|nr:P27 family phage terminase small subunit [Caulifigura coniformis]QDT54646.1 Phage terminase, small subunit [Caulifigura coniformis]
MAKKSDPWSAPTWLVDAAKEWWERIVAELKEKGLLARSSKLTVAVLAQLFHQYDVACHSLVKDGLTQACGGGVNRDPHDIPSAAVEIQHNHITQMVKLIRELKLNSEPIGDEDSSAIGDLARQLQARSGMN